jgi:dihydroorotase
LIKWNPAVKLQSDRDAIWQGVLTDRIDVLATDHAPHTLQEKQNTYLSAPSGGPLVQHSLVAAMELVLRGKMTVAKMVEKMCHNPAILFNVADRGFVREGYFADLVLVDPESSWVVDKSNILYKSGWSPFEGTAFSSKVTHTFVSGRVAYENGQIIEGGSGMRLTFSRQ